jgi:hypothetical protein
MECLVTKDINKGTGRKEHQSVFSMPRLKHKGIQLVWGKQKKSSFS